MAITILPRKFSQAFALQVVLKDNLYQSLRLLGLAITMSHVKSETCQVTPKPVQKNLVTSEEPVFKRIKSSKNKICYP